MEYIGGYTSIDFLKRCEGYDSAKDNNDIAAADAIVKKCVGTDQLQYIKKKYPDAILLPVINRGNVLPLALCINIGLPICLTVQCFTRYRRTGMSAIGRIVYRPVFSGDITPGKKYILVDDVITQGATISALNYFVTQNGGKVCAVSSLARARGNVKIAPSKENRDKLKQRFGRELALLLEEYGLGKDGIKQLSNSEALYLLKFSNIENIRAKIDEDTDLLLPTSVIVKKAKIGMQTEKLTTKDKILYAAIRLFSARGYTQVHMSEIAKTAGYEMSTVYKLFHSKSELLTSIYEFYAYQRKLHTPDVDKLISDVDLSGLQTVLKKLVFDSPLELEDTMIRILAIAIRGVGMNSECEQFVRENLLEPTINIYKPLLNRLIESGCIEPIDIDGFIDLYMSFDYFAASLDPSSLRIGCERWLRGRAMILSLLKQK